MIQLNSDYINKIQLLNDDLFQYIDLVDYDGDGEEYIFSFDGKAKTKWAIEKFGEDKGSIIEWTSDEIHELLEETIDSKECTTHDKIFLDHFILLIYHLMVLRIPVSNVSIGIQFNSFLILVASIAYLKS